MKLEIGKHYKVVIGEDIELKTEYSYFICIGELDDHWLLHEMEHWAELNGRGEFYDNIEDVDDYFKDAIDLYPKHYKRFNSLESVYYKTKTVEAKPTESKKKFVIA